MNSLNLEELDKHHVDPTPLLATEGGVSGTISAKKSIPYRALILMETPQMLPPTTRTIVGGFILFCSLVLVLYMPMVLFGSLVIGRGSNFILHIFLGNIYPILVLVLIYGYTYMVFYQHGPVASLKRQIQFSSYLLGKDSCVVSQRWFKLSVILEMMGQHERAIDCCRNIVLEGYECNSHVCGAPYHFRLGKLLYSVGKYKESIFSFEAAARLVRQKKGSSKLPSYLHCIGFAHEKNGQLEDSLKYHKLALEEAKKLGPTSSQTIDTAKSLIIVGAAHSLLDQFQQAIESYEGALSLYMLNLGEFPQIRAVARLHVRIGETHRKTSNISSALESYQLAINVYRRCGLPDENEELAQVIRAVSEVKEIV